jgi:heme/copper-type cytochrome/quinol oxidase subunit 4
MKLDFLEVLGVVGDMLNLLASNSYSSDLSDDNKPVKKKRTKYFTIKVSIGFILISSVLLFFVFKDPLPAENYVQTIVVCSLIGLAISLIFFFLMYILEKYYFKSVFQWLFFSCSVILFFVSVVLCVYFESGIFI